MAKEIKRYPSISKQLGNIKESFHHNITYLTNKDYRHKVRMSLSPEEIEDRMSICRECDRYDAAQNRCRECGCYMVVKARFGTESCPLNKWTAMRYDEDFNRR